MPQPDSKGPIDLRAMDPWKVVRFTDWPRDIVVDAPALLQISLPPGARARVRYHHPDGSHLEDVVNGAADPWQLP